MVEPVPGELKNPFYSIAEKKICMLGCHEVGAALIPRLLNLGLKFESFVSISRDQAERANVSGYFDFSDMAEMAEVEIRYSEKFNLAGESDLAFFREKQFDLIIQGGWPRLIPETILKTLTVGALGVHGSADFLPKGRGRSPKNWSLIQNKRRFLLQMFLIEPGVDDGPVFDYEAFDINEFDDITTLYWKNVLAQEKILLRSLVPILDGTATLYPQTGQGDYFEKRSSTDGEIDFEKMDVHEIYNFVRAQTRPYPGAFGNIIGLGQVTLWKTQVFDTRILYPNKKYGEIIADFEGNLVVNCRGGLLLITDYESSK